MDRMRCPLDTNHGDVVCRNGVLWALTYSECAPPDQRQAIGDCEHCARGLHQHSNDISHMAPVVVPEPVTKAVERILDEHSAWIARPNKEVTDKIALACTVAAQRIIEETSAIDAQPAALNPTR
jgi:hypothetical protein